MSRPGRKLSPDEAALWAQVARTVAPLDGRQLTLPAEAKAQPSVPAPMVRAAKVRPSLPRSTAPAPVPASPRGGNDIASHGLDSRWDRDLTRGTVHPDFTLDLHGASLDAAHGRLLHGLTQAKVMGARVVLLITGKPRPVDAADRGHRRGAIRAKVIDWLASSEHALDIAAIRNAHRRHGGQGALYIVLKRRR